MKIPSTDTLGLHADILTESVLGEDRLVLWLPAGEAEGSRLWERISSAAGPAQPVGTGLVAVAAVRIPVREQARGRLGHLWQRIWDSDDAESWNVPTGEVAEPHGDKDTNVVLVWAEPSSAALTESIVRAVWPQATRFQLLGTRLALVGGVVHGVLPPETTGAIATAALDAARSNGDRRQEATALVDVGLVHLDGGDIPRAREAFQQALSLALTLGDRQIEGDACAGHGTIGLLAGNPHESLQFFQRELSAAQQAKSPVAEKTALAHLGVAYSALRSPESALGAFEQALTLARQVGDRVHEAELPSVAGRPKLYPTARLPSISTQRWE
jgi:tetratricopeptide (TPR) repeat protein